MARGFFMSSLPIRMLSEGAEEPMADAQAERQAREVADVLSAAQGFARLHVAQRGITARKVTPQCD